MGEGGKSDSLAKKKKGLVSFSYLNNEFLFFLFLILGCLQ